MTNEEAINTLKSLKDYYNDKNEDSYVGFDDEDNEALDIAIKALEQQPNRCDSCIHSEEWDGSSCYECVKNMADNFETWQTDKCKGCYYDDGEVHAECVICDKEAQPKTGYISINVTKLAKEVAEKALDEITYEGKTIREWAELLVKQQPCEDAISRSELLRHQHIIYDDDEEGYRAVYVKDIKAMPSVTPERPNPDVVEKMKKAIDEMTEIHSDGEFYIKNVDAKWIINKYLYGAEMSGGGEDGDSN